MGDAYDDMEATRAPTTEDRLRVSEQENRGLRDAIRSALDDLPDKCYDAEATLKRAIGEEP